MLWPELEVRHNWIAAASAEHARRACALPARRALPGGPRRSDGALLDQFEFVEEHSRWGAKFRFGLFQISDHDMRLIALAMQAELSALDL